MKNERSYLSLFWALVLVGSFLDLYSKYTVFQWLDDGETSRGEHELIPGVFKLYCQFTGESEESRGVFASLRTLTSNRLPHVNHGALFGLAGDYRQVANAVFATVSVIATLAIVFWCTRQSTARDGLLCLALGLILAGTLGNLYDRIVFGGVRDFLYFYLINWPVFNFADCCLVCGAGLLLVQAFLNHPTQVASQTRQEVTSAEMAEVK